MNVMMLFFSHVFMNKKLYHNYVFLFIFERMNICVEITNKNRLSKMIRFITKTLFLNF